jgi:hypothetical protein
VITGAVVSSFLQPTVIKALTVKVTAARVRICFFMFELVLGFIAIFQAELNYHAKVPFLPGKQKKFCV